MSDMDPIAEAIRRAGWTHDKLAQVLGISRPAASDRMRGRTRWTLVEAHQLSLLLGVSLDELMGGEHAA